MPVPIMHYVHHLHAFNDNYIWLLGNCALEDASHPLAMRKAIIVDPGDADPVVAALEKWRLTLIAILITHHHNDHIGGIHRLASRYHVPVYGPKKENIAGVTHALEDDDIIDLGPDLPLFRVIDVPGHTAGHIAYYSPGLLFCGDTLFTGGCGRLFEGTADQLYSSLQKLARLPDDTLVYCAHEYTLSNLKFAMQIEPDNGNLASRIAECEKLSMQENPTVPATLALEKLTNPFLRCHEPAVIAAAERFAAQAVTPGAPVFAVIRHWKDTFR